jgi:hypothetical protein
LEPLKTTAKLPESSAGWPVIWKTIKRKTNPTFCFSGLYQEKVSLLLRVAELHSFKYILMDGRHWSDEGFLKTYQQTLTLSLNADSSA